MANEIPKVHPGRFVTYTAHDGAKRHGVCRSEPAGDGARIDIGPIPMGAPFARAVPFDTDGNPDSWRLYP